MTPQQKIEHALRLAIQRLFKTGDGKRVMSYLIEEYLYVSQFSSDPLLMAYNQGKKDLVNELSLHSIRDYSPEEMKLLTEPHNV